MRSVLSAAARSTILLPLLAGAAACGGAGSPTASGSSSGGGSVERREVTLTAIGDTGSTAGLGAPALVSERRWLHDAAVLDASALAAGRLVAAAPGTAEVEARNASGGVVRVTVRVAPARPVVLSASSVADTVVLRGFGMDRAGTVRIGGVEARTVAADSATARLVPAPRTDAVCASGGAREPVSAEGADVRPGVAAVRPHADVLSLAVGATARLSAARAACLRLAPAAGARYALAFVDPRAVRAAATGFEGTAPSPNQYTARIVQAEATAPAALRLPPSASLNRAPDHVRLNASSAPGAVFSRAVPWSAGERFEVRDAGLAAPLAARVVRVYGGHLVLAVAEGEEPAGGAEAWLARADSAFALMARHGDPLLRQTLSPNAPTTGAGSGQLLVIARREQSAYLGSTLTTASGGQASSMVFLNSAYTFTGAGLLRTLAHEVAHAWQEQWARDRRGDAIGTGAAAWAMEGGADLLAAAVVRRALGIGAGANWNWAAHVGDPALAPYAGVAAGARGDLTAGYTSAASFLLDLSSRLAARGMAEGDALAEVSAGALEGWYGFARSGARGRGLAARMRDRVGAGWDPVDALLTWTLSQAADDLTGSAALQNPAFARAGTAGEASGAGWLAAARLVSGGRALRVDPASAASVAGNAATVPARYGSAGYVWIDDDAFGAAYRLTAEWNGAPLEAEWMIVRVR